MSSSITYLGKKVWPRVKANQYKRESWLSLKWRQVKYWTRITLQIVAIAGVLALAATIGALVYGNQIVVQNTLVTPEKGTAPVMQRIFNAESGGMQVSPRTGQVVYNINYFNAATGKWESCGSRCSLDLGIGEINVETWGKKAHDLGFDLTKKEDNIAFSKWLYANYGTSPWQSSQGKNNWN